ncbi:hypothetical protein [Bradyrhizobium sp. STM 3557]|uniref:hypothetical protein n=1 Tax=Bradyrhizobium sp. STM 3557 TaxID=578920 RepID=UPI00388F4B76
MTIPLVEQQIERALDFAERVRVIERSRTARTGSSVELRSVRGLVDRLLGVGIR